MRTSYRKNLLLIGGFILLSKSALALNEPKPSLVSVKQAKQQQISPTVWLSGNVISRLDSRISSEQNGRLTWILDIGSQVNKGDPIAKLDARELKLQIEERQAQLRRQQANINYLKEQKKRLKALLSNNSTSRIELDRVVRDLNVAKEELAVLETQIKRNQLAIEKTIVRAPFDGQINRRLSQPGEYVTAGTALVQLVDPVSLDISVAAPLSLASYLTRESQVLVKWNDQLKTIPVRTWSPAGDQSTRTFNVRLDASNLNLLSGEDVTVSMPSAQVSLSTMVPRDALILRDKETYVVTVDKENVVHKVSVLLGHGEGDWISVNGLISAGDQVIVRGGERLKEGQKVRLDKNSTSETSDIAAY